MFKSFEVSRILLPPIDPDLQILMTQAAHLNTLVAAGVNYRENKRNLIDRRTLIATRWSQVEAVGLEDLVSKTNLEKNPKMFWQKIHKMLGHRKPNPPTELFNEYNLKLQTPIEITEAFQPCYTMPLE